MSDCRPKRANNNLVEHCQAIEKLGFVKYNIPRNFGSMYLTQIAVIGALDCDVRKRGVDYSSLSLSRRKPNLSHYFAGYRFW
jgi:hypothetical protein